MQAKLEYEYYISNHNFNSTDEQDLSPGTRIFKITKGRKWSISQSNGPYLSIRNLRRNSPIFKSLESENGKRAHLITQDKYIKELTNNGVVSPIGVGYPMEFIKLVEHATKGSVKNGKIRGVHFFDPKKVRLLKVVREDKDQVFEAEFEFLDYKTKKWIKKEGSSSFFPKSWDLNRLFHECSHAYFDAPKNKIEGLHSKYSSRTLSGVLVHLVYSRNGELKTIYPVLV